MHRIMHRSHVGDNRVVFVDRVAALGGGWGSIDKCVLTLKGLLSYSLDKTFVNCTKTENFRKIKVIDYKVIVIDCL